MEVGTWVEPLMDKRAFDAMEAALARAKADGGKIHGGERVVADRYPAAWYARPALVEMPGQTAIVCEETFAPIRYAMHYETLDEALALQNGVKQGLASAIFTTDLREAERFMSAEGSDCGIVNVNIGPSGAEIGGVLCGAEESAGGAGAG